MAQARIKTTWDTRKFALSANPPSTEPDENGFEWWYYMLPDPNDEDGYCLLIVEDGDQGDLDAAIAAADPQVEDAAGEARVVAAEQSAKRDRYLARELATILVGYADGFQWALARMQDVYQRAGQQLPPPPQSTVNAVQRVRELADRFPIDGEGR